MRSQPPLKHLHRAPSHPPDTTALLFTECANWGASSPQASAGVQVPQQVHSHTVLSPETATESCLGFRQQIIEGVPFTSIYRIYLVKEIQTRHDVVFTVFVLWLTDSVHHTLELSSLFHMPPRGPDFWLRHVDLSATCKLTQQLSRSLPGVCLD